MLSASEVGQQPATRAPSAGQANLLNVYQYYCDFPAQIGPINGGIEKAVAGLAGGIAEDDSARCTVLCEGEREIELSRPEGFVVRCFQTTGPRRNKFALAPSLRRFVLEQIEPDSLVVLHAIFHPRCSAMSRLLRKRGVRYIVTPHDPYHPTMFASGRLKKSIYWRLFERPMLQHAVAVQVLDRRHEKYLRERGVSTPVIEVGNGFSPNEVPDESTLSWTAEGPIRILYLGRLDPVNKGLDLLIEAFCRLSKSRDDLQLTLQGRDEGEGKIVRNLVADAGLGDRIQLLPPDFSARASEITARHDLFVLPSRFEGFGLSALEAMLAGRPVLISDIAGLAPHVGRSGGGVVVDSTAQSIAAGLEQLIARRPDWREIGMNGRRYVLENLRWSPIARGALRDYRAIMH